MLANAGYCCTTCPNQHGGEYRVLPEGRGTSGVLLLGDSPWKDEVAAHLPFAGPAGGLLNRLIHSVGAEREDFIITNTVWCKPPALGFTDKAAAAPVLAQCRPYLDELISEVKPRCIVPMGNVALRRICDASRIDQHHAYVHDTPYGPAVPTYHPAFLIRGTSEVAGEKSRNLRYFPVVVFALKRALEVAQGKFQRPSTEYLLDAPLSDVEAYVARYSAMQKAKIGSGKGTYCFSSSSTGPDNSSIPLVFLDLETPESHLVEGGEEEASSAAGRLKLHGPILRVSISLWPSTAVSVPWQEPFITWFKEVLSHASALAAWNGYDADFPKLRAEGVLGGGSPGGLREHVLLGSSSPALVDPLWTWHFLQSDLPKALGFVAPFFWSGPAWKHLQAAEPAYYNACDADAGLTCLLGIREALERQGRWNQFTRHCIQTEPILELMGQAGVLIDRNQQQIFQERLKGEYEEAYVRLQGAVPDKVKPVKRWKRPPKDMAGVRIVEVPVEEVDEAEETTATLF